MTIRRICFVTAARSEYDIMYPVIEAVNCDPRLASEAIVVGAHLSPFHGMGIESIRSDGVQIAGVVESLLSSESRSARALSFAHLTEGLTRMLSVQKPDVLVIAGDREEALAVALVGNFLGIHVAHLHGGDRCIASDVDEVLRPAISKLSHLHFVATDGHRERLIHMGEVPENVWTTGAPGLDRLRTTVDIPDDTLSKEFNIDVTKPFYLLIYHSSPLLDAERCGEEMAIVLRAVLSTGWPVFCSYPNQDPGNISIRRAIDAARCQQLIVSHNLHRDRFVALYRRCTAIVGNSSSIVIESGYLRVAGILVGDRQNLRETGPNVIRVAARENDVRLACERTLHDAAFRLVASNAPSLYGDGHAAPRIAKIFADCELAPDMLCKTMSY
jgi:GDP/UDP-N,N'-diacetylbacillosamine 2-epimerase (hydrolysing)